MKNTHSILAKRRERKALNQALKKVHSNSQEKLLSVPSTKF
jgi:hypothetical protein